MSDIDWCNLFKEEDYVDQWWVNFENSINEVKEMFILKRRQKNLVTRSFHAPTTLLESMQMKRSAFKTFKTFPSDFNPRTHGLFQTTFS